MTTTLSEPLSILKGPAFQQRLEQICGQLPRRQPFADLKYANILMPQIVGGEIPFAIMGFLGQAMRLRGAEVTTLLCDSFLPACVCRKVDHYESACTRWCHKNSAPFAATMKLPHRWHSEFISPAEMDRCRETVANIPPERIRSFHYRDVNIGSLIDESVDSYFLVGRCDLADPQMRAKAYDFVLSGMYLTIIANRVFDELHIDKVLTDSGEHVDWGVFRAVAAQRGIPVDIVNVGLRGNSLKVETDRPDRPTERVPGWDAWRHQPLTAAQNRALDEYLCKREKVPYEYKGEKWQGRITDLDDVRRMISLPAQPAGKVFSMFPNMGYDAGRLKTKAAFAHITSWIAETIAWFDRHREHHLIIKIHPAEVHRDARDPTLDFINEGFDRLPPNVHPIPPVTDITAQSVVKLSDVVTAYTSTVAAEAVGLGKPVILTGGGRHGGHGATIDVDAPQEFFRILDDICSGRWMPESPGELGRRYAYAVFFRADIPLIHFRKFDMDVAEMFIESYEGLLPGADPCIDMMCRGVLCDEPFENPRQPE